MGDLQQNDMARTRQSILVPLKQPLGVGDHMARILGRLPVSPQQVYRRWQILGQDIVTLCMMVAVSGSRTEHGFLN